MAKLQNALAKNIPVWRDEIRTLVKKHGDKKISDVSFQGKGCAICTASASLMTQCLKDKSTEEAGAIFAAFHSLVTDDNQENTDSQVLGKLEVFSGVRKYPIRVKCATLPWHTLNAALSKKGESVSTE